MDHIQDEAAMLVMELQSKQSTHQDVAFTLSKIKKLKEEYPSIVTPLVDHMLMMEEGDFLWTSIVSLVFYALLSM